MDDCAAIQHLLTAFQSLRAKVANAVTPVVTCLRKDGGVAMACLAAKRGGRAAVHLALAANLRALDQLDVSADGASGSMLTRVLRASRGLVDHVLAGEMYALRSQSLLGKEPKTKLWDALYGYWASVQSGEGVTSMFASTPAAFKLRRSFGAGLASICAEYDVLGSALANIAIAVQECEFALAV